MNLTMIKKATRVDSTATQFAVGVSVPQYREQIGSHSKSFFYACLIMVGCMGLPSGRSHLGSDNANSVQSATQSVSVDSGGSQKFTEDTNMSNSNVAPLRPTNNQITFSVPETDKTIPLDELVLNLPEFLETALSYIVSDFDYENNITSNTAVAVRILATMVDRLNTSLEQCHE